LGIIFILKNENKEKEEEKELLHYFHPNSFSVLVNSRAKKFCKISIFYIRILSDQLNDNMV
jgi:hypothetical protein